MQGKRTRSSGPVELIVSTFSKEEETTQPLIKPRKERQIKIKAPEQPKKEVVVKNKPFKEHCLKNPSKYKERLQGEASVKKHSKIQVPKSGIAQMTKEQQERMNRILNIVVKTREFKMEKEKNTPSQPYLQKKQQQKSQQKKKQALVDLHFSRGDTVRVYIDSKGFAFSATFNQTDVSKNANKFYIMQILQIISHPEQFYLFTRWGRVGLAGHKAQAGPLSLEQALENYRAKIQQKLQHGYKKIETETENQRRNFYFPQREKKKEVQSKLDTKVQALIRLLFDMKMVASQLKEIGLDAKKMPLGKVAASTIIKGYEALKEVMEALRARKPKDVLNDLSSKFYSHIPHDFGMKVLSNYVLDSEKRVRDKLQLMQSLQDIQTFTKMIDEPQMNPDLNELDANYLKLSYHIAPLPTDSPLHATIMKYIQNTHAPSHSDYRIELNTIYELTPRKESDFLAEIGNRQLLWHGSRLTNFVGILSSGLRIAPPEAPATGYMFGKGVYFADVVSKSANYCHATKLNPIGCLLLCEVALGNCIQKFYADYYANLLPEDCHSVKGVGRSAPRDTEKVGEMSVPNGPLVDSGISNTCLHFNEYVVYDVRQIRCRFLLRVKFLFK